MLLTNVSVPTEGIEFQQQQTTVFMTANGQTKESPEGTLYVTHDRLTFVHGDNSGTGFSLAYPQIEVHGMATDGSMFQKPHIYMILSLPPNDVAPRADIVDTEQNGLEENHDEESAEITELRIVPRDAGVLNDIYQAISRCSAMHPDPDQEIDEDEEFYGNPYDEGEEGGDNDTGDLHNADVPQFDENGQLIIYRANDDHSRDDGNNEDDDAMEM